jgi:predicted amidohydrolase
MELLGLQTDIAWHDRRTNHTRVREMLGDAKPAGGSLVVLPEMFASGFSGDVAAATEGAAESEAYLASLAREFGVAVMAGLATRSGDCAANISITFGPDGAELARYTKLHPFSTAREDENYPAGNRIVLFSFGGFTIAPFICYDLRFPEIFREATGRGADLIAVVANWPDRRHHHWSTLLRARAIENMAGVIGVNRAGADPAFTYAGGSVILGPQAEVLAEAGAAPAVIRAELSPAAVAEWRAAFPALRDRRNDIASL